MALSAQSPIHIVCELVGNKEKAWFSKTLLKDSTADSVVKGKHVEPGCKFWDLHCIQNNLVHGHLKQ